MRFLPILAIAALALSGCKTLDFGGDKTATVVTVVSTPPGALVTVEGFGECETPCTVEIDKPRNITVAKAGYDAQKMVLVPSRRTVEVLLKLSTQTTDVDATELPEL